MIALACASAPPLGCRTIEGTWGVPPFYEEYDNPSRIVGSPGRETLFRPFVTLEEGPDRFHIRSFPPIFQYHEREDRHHIRLLPIFLHRRVHQPEGVDSDWVIFPFLFWGHEADGGSYLAVFPLGGKIKGLFAQDEVRFALFPLYWKTRDGDKHSLHMLWPLFNTVWGGGRTGWRVWPFYGQYEAETARGEPRFERHFVLWPFWIHRREFIYLSPVETVFSFPFYGHRTGERFEVHTYLWPLAQTYHDKLRDRTVYQGFLFPYRFGDDQTDVWPLFGVKTREDDADSFSDGRRRYRQYALWPIQRYDWTQSSNMEITRFWLLPLYWHFHYLDADTLRSSSVWHFWPLLSYRREGDEVGFNFLSPIWLVNRSYERYYSRFFRVFRYRYKPELWGWEVLWGAMMYRADKERDEKLFSILGGLLEVGSREDSFALRILYLPLW